MPADIRRKLRSERTIFFGSQLGGSSVTNYSYTDSPSRLLILDALLCLRHIRALPSIIFPLTPWSSGAMDELYPNTENIVNIALQGFLLICQLALGVVVFLVAFLPTWVAVVAIGGFITVNALLSRYALNGSEKIYWSNPDLVPFRREHDSEQWIFINGVGAGRLWLQNSIDRLAITFGRPVMGIHNRTYGILFDLIECLIQRSFGYATDDIRLAYATVKHTLYYPDIKRVVIIAHSQGGIVASMVTDWALQELPQDLLSKVEIYTFGSAANHFNSPARAKASVDAQFPSGLANANLPKAKSIIDQLTKSSTFPVAEPIAAEKFRDIIATASGDIPLGTAQDRTIGHIEHYAHTTDFVSLFSVLHFATLATPRSQVPSYMGRVFARTSAETGGHQFVQHYLDGMFPLRRTEKGTYVASDESEFMDSELHIVNEYRVRESPREATTTDGAVLAEQREDFEDRNLGAGWIVGRDVSVRLMTYTTECHRAVMKVKDISRLWHYRNGRSPER